LALAARKPAAGDNVIRLGQSTALTGANGAVGRQFRDAALAWFEAVNAQGGASGLRFELTDSVFFFRDLNLTPIVSGLGHSSVYGRQRVFDKSQLIGQRQSTAERQTNYTLQIQPRLFRRGLSLGEADLLFSQSC